MQRAQSDQASSGEPGTKGDHTKKRRAEETAMTTQEDQDGESWVFVVQVIYLTMGTTSIKSEITDM